MNKQNVTTLRDLVNRSAQCYEAKPFIREKNGKEIAEFSYREMRDHIFQVASFLRTVSSETLHAAVIGPTSAAYLAAWFGTAVSGNVAVPLDAQLPCPDLIELLQRADVRVFFYDKRYAPMREAIKAACPKITHYVCLQDDGSDLTVPAIFASYSPAEELPALSPDALAAIVYTSGTTGKSKGVMLSHGNYIDNVFCMDAESNPDDVLLSVLPIHHVFCFTCDFLLSFRYGTTVCVNDSMMRIAMNLQLFQPTLVLMVPMIAQTILKQIRAASAAKPEVPIQALAQHVFGGKLRGILCGGAYLSPEISKAYEELGIPIAQGYGMTECSPRISSVKVGDGNDGDVGIIVNGCEVRIEDGEIVVKSGSVMQGYYKDPEATAEVLVDGWLHTGDLGYVANGRVFITGRKKNLIILSNGENVSPEELENKFADSDLVAEVLVYDDESVITAEIYPSEECCKAMGMDAVKDALRALIDDVNKTVTSSKTIRRIRLREMEFDKTTSKKIRRQQSVHGEMI